MPTIDNIFVSVVYVADQHASLPADQVKNIASILRSHYANYEVLVIDNGLSPEAIGAIKTMLQAVPCIRLVRLARIYDTDTAIFAGVDASIGDLTCILYNNDPPEVLPDFVKKNAQSDIVFGVAENLHRQKKSDEIGAKLFYWYSRRYLNVNLPKNSTYYMSMNRTAANALTRSGRFMRHIRHMAQQVGFTSDVLRYKLPSKAQPYSHTKGSTQVHRAIDLVSNYSSHPLRMLSYLGLTAGALNIAYAIYVVIMNLSSHSVAKGWTTTSLQSSLMFFMLFLILSVLSEYIGKILNETQKEPPYHIRQELSSTINIADETRRNVKK